MILLNLNIVIDRYDDFLPALKFVPNWFVTSKTIKNFFTALYADENINLDDTNYDEEYPETIIHIRLSAWHIKFEKLKSPKKA